MKWVSTLSTGGAARYDHWDIRGGNWIGQFNVETESYDTINYDNIAHSVKVVAKVIEMYKDNPIVIGLEPINEVSQFTEYMCFMQPFTIPSLRTAHAIPHKLVYTYMLTKLGLYTYVYALYSRGGSSLWTSCRTSTPRVTKWCRPRSRGGSPCCTTLSGI